MDIGSLCAYRGKIMDTIGIRHRLKDILDRTYLISMN